MQIHNYVVPISAILDIVQSQPVIYFGFADGDSSGYFVGGWGEVGVGGEVGDYIGGVVRIYGAKL